jgi:flagellar biosynthetic protein FlhB
MADGSDAERTEEPTARRLQEARERGQLPRSQELGNFATMIGGSAVLVATGAHLVTRLADLMRGGLEIDAASIADPGSMLTRLGANLIDSVLLLLPLFAALVILILAAAVALGGWNFSPQALAPDFTRLSPLAGLRRLFGLRGFSDLAKALLKCVVVGAVCAAVCMHLFDDVIALGHMTPKAAIGRSAGLLGWAFVCLCASLGVIAVVDVPLQIFQFNRMMRMTRQEVRDETKDSEGRPETKRRIRQMQQQIARRRMMHKVPTADVVIVNPTHFAVALKYDPAKMRAPRVLAKGVDLVALNIRRIAEEHRVPIFDSPRLARALYRTTDLDKEIPTALYMAVAQVLSYVFRIRAMNPTLAARVARPDPKVDDESGDELP